MCASFAQVTDGFYRIQNNSTDRYITVWDNTFDVSVSTTDVDLSALVTIRDFNKIVCDPGSIMYIDNNENNECRLKAQGTDTYVASGGYYLKLRPQNNGTYMATVTAQGIMKMLGDSPDPNKSRDQAYVGTYKEGDTRYWRIKPLNTTDNYFGLSPVMTDGTSYYQTLFVSFAFSAISEDMAFYKVTIVDQGVAVIEEIEGEVPANTPVIVKAKYRESAKNMLNVSLTPATAINGNLLKGNFFNYWKRAQQTPYVPSTMRVLGKLSDGGMGFIKDPSLDFLERNSAYINVPEDFPDEVRLVTPEEYSSIIAGISNVKAEDNVTVYDLYGRKVATTSNREDALRALPPGLYVVNGRKHLVR